MADTIKLAKATSKISDVQVKLSTVMTMMESEPVVAAKALRIFAERLKEAATQIDLAQG